MAWTVHYHHGGRTEWINSCATAHKAFDKATDIANQLAKEEASEQAGYYDDYYKQLARMSIRGSGIELYRLRSVHGPDYDAFWRRYSFIIYRSPLRFKTFWIAIKATAQITMQARTLDDLIRGIQVGVGPEKPLRPYARLQIYEISSSEPDAYAYKCLIRARRGGN